MDMSVWDRHIPYKDVTFGLKPLLNNNVDAPIKIHLILKLIWCTETVVTMLLKVL